MSSKLKTLKPFQTLSAWEMYRNYVDALIKNEPDKYRGKYANGRANDILLVRDEKENLKWKVKTTYKRFKYILSKINRKFGAYLIHGKSVNLLNGLGYLEIVRVERDFTKPTLNKAESFKLRKELKEAGELTEDNWKIFYTDDDYIRTSWAKLYILSSIQYYTFIPSGGQPGKGFRQEMVRAIKSNPVLKANYTYRERK